MAPHLLLDKKSKLVNKEGIEDAMKRVNLSSPTEIKRTDIFLFA